jgi:hypothetical protein
MPQGFGPNGPDFLRGLLMTLRRLRRVRANCGKQSSPSYGASGPALQKPETDVPGILLNWNPGSQERLDFTKLFASC